MYKNLTISVVIPCHNEEAGIEKTYHKIPKFVDEVVVVDNLSTDRTAEVAGRLGARVVREKNKGYGYALKKGILSAKGKIIITIDGDSTYPVEDSRSVVDYLLNEKADFISCSRFPLRNRDSMYWQNYRGNQLVTKLMSILFGHRFSDGLSGMWVFKKSAFPKLLPLSSSWNLSEEIKIEAHLHPKIKFAEYLVSYHPRCGKSKVWPMKVGLENIVYLGYLRFIKKRRHK